MSSNMHIQFCIALVLLFSAFSTFEAQLQVGFYGTTCPSAESIVTQTVTAAFNSDQGVAPGLIRMHFHDCFDTGCDGSVLIDSVGGNTAEKDSPVNNPSLRAAAFQAIDAAKTALEAQCPGIVSCADILAFAARDAVGLANGPAYSAEGGRMDGRVSVASNVTINIPAPTMNVASLTQLFGQKGLTQDEMVTLAGAHTLGQSHCSIITTLNDRLYNFNSTNAPDPTLNSAYLTQLQQECPQASTSTTSVVPMDPTTPAVFDSNYYTNIIANRGLFTSDATLQTNAATMTAVSQNSQNQAAWFNKFTAAMIKMGQIGAGTAGEIRTNCRVIN